MKKIVLSLFILTTTLVSSAQVEVTTKSIDLEPLNKHKNWVVGDASIDSNTGNVLVNMKQLHCDGSKSSTFTAIEYTFRGLSWNIDKLIFDAGFNYIESKSMQYKTTEEALLNGENVYGKKYNVRLGSGIAGAAVSGVAMPKGAIDNSFMFTNIVTGTSGMTGFKVAVSYIGLKVEGEVSKQGAASCSENPAVFKVSSEDAKEEKGQRWIPMYNNPVPNGGNILFNTSGVLKEEKGYYVFRKYDKDANIIKEQTFTFDYQCILNGMEIEKAPGEFDYIFIATPINYKKSKMPLAPANSYQYFYVDGNTFEIKEQLTFTAPNSEWLVNHVTHENGTTYLVGTCGEKSTVYKDIFDYIPKVDAYENIQVVKIENGKLVYAKSTMNKDLKSAFKTIDGLKSNSSVNFCMPYASLSVSNGKLIYSGQQQYGVIIGSLQTIIFDNNGEVETVLSKQEKTMARSHLSFSKDGQKIFWLLEQIDEYNKIEGTTITPKKAREVVSSLSILTYDLEANNITKFQNLENEEWAVNYKNPILMDNENTIIMLGNKITKKAKESELIFITIKK